MEHRPHIHPQRLLALACLAVLALNVSLVFYVQPFSDFLQGHWRMVNHTEYRFQTCGMIFIVLAVLGLAAYALINLIAPGKIIAPYDGDYEN